MHDLFHITSNLTPQQFQYPITYIQLLLNYQFLYFLNIDRNLLLAALAAGWSNTRSTCLLTEVIHVCV